MLDHQNERGRGIDAVYAVHHRLSGNDSDAIHYVGPDVTAFIRRILLGDDLVGRYYERVYGVMTKGPFDPA